MAHVNFTKVLGNREFTYAFFDRIAGDFNGDLFPVTNEEKQAVTESHLRLLQRFLGGEIADDIPRLFFFAYRFDVIPIELISSIYEAFYNAEKGTDQNQGRTTRQSNSSSTSFPRRCPAMSWRRSVDSRSRVRVRHFPG